MQQFAAQAIVASRSSLLGKVPFSELSGSALRTALHFTSSYLIDLGDVAEGADEDARHSGVAIPGCSMQRRVAVLLGQTRVAMEMKKMRSTDGDANRMRQRKAPRVSKEEEKVKARIITKQR